MCRFTTPTSTGRWSVTRRKLTYNALAAWLDGQGPAPVRADVGSPTRGSGSPAGPHRGTAARLPRSRRCAGVRAHRTQADRRRRRRQRSARRNTESRQVGHRELHGRGQRRHRADSCAIAGFAVDSPCRQVARTLDAHRRSRGAAWRISCPTRQTRMRCRHSCKRAAHGASPTRSRICRWRSSSCSGAANMSPRARRSQVCTSRSRPGITRIRRRRTGATPISSHSV